MVCCSHFLGAFSLNDGAKKHTTKSPGEFYRGLELFSELSEQLLELVRHGLFISSDKPPAAYGAMNVH